MLFQISKEQGGQEECFCDGNTANFVVEDLIAGRRGTTSIRAYGSAMAETPIVTRTVVQSDNINNHNHHHTG